MATRRKKQLSEKQSQAQSEHWLQSKWRPMMAWQYMVVCLFDFIVGPIMWAFVQAITYKSGVPASSGQPAVAASVITQWQPLTLQGAGFYHITMATILGISAWSRGQEKMKSMDKETVSVVEEERREEKVERVIER